MFLLKLLTENQFLQVQCIWKGKESITLNANKRCLEASIIESN